MPPIVAAAIGGNLWHEGGFRTTAIGDNKTDPKRGLKPVYGFSHGPIQVNRERWERMLVFNHNHPLGTKNNIMNIDKPTEKEMQTAQVYDYRVRLDFVALELSDNYSKVYGKMKAAGKDLSMATRIFQNNYERPNPKYAHFEKRLYYAKVLAKNISKQEADQLAFVNSEVEKGVAKS